MSAKRPTDTDQIENLLRGHLTPAEAERLATELADDSRVVEVATGLSDDTLMSDIRKADTSTDPDTEQLAERLAERLKPAASSVAATTLPSTDGPIMIGEDDEETMPLTFEYFKVERVLGQGGMGTVYLADDTRLGRKVAVKTLKASVARRPKAKERFLREARLAAGLEHECVVPIYYVGEADGIPFLAMPLLKGQGLDEYLGARGGKLPVAEATRVAAQVAAGLAAAHAAGLIHRDIKPSNIWVDTGGRVRILDFGLARSADDNLQLTASGMIVGTPAYMPPEQARGRGVDHRADLFSLGVVLYQMLVGRRPFVGDDTVALLSSLALDTPTAPHILNPEVPPAVSVLVMRLLEKDPANRPQSAAEVAVALAPPAPPSWRTAERTELDLAESAEPKPARTTAGETKWVAPRQPAPAGRTSGRKIPLAAWVALGLLLLAGGAAAVYQFTFATKDGTLIVEIDQDADVRFKNGKLEVYDDAGKKLYTLEPSEKNKTLPPGKYRVKVVGADGVKLDTETFEIEKKGKAWVKVTAAPPQVAVVDPKKPDPVTPGTPGGAGLLLHFNGLGAEAPTPPLDPRKPWTVEAYFTPLTDHLAKTKCQIVGCDPETAFALGVKDGKYYVYSFHGLLDGGTVTAGERVHLACVQTETKRMMFLNGKLVGSADNPLAVEKVASGKLQFFLKNHGPNQPPLDVLVEGVRISQAVRYTKGFTPPGRHVPDKETLALYHCDESQGDKLTDSSGNNLHGKITNAKWGKPTGATVPPPSAAGGLHLFVGDIGAEAPAPALDPQKPWTAEAYLTPLTDDVAKNTCRVVGADQGFGLGVRDGKYFGYSIHGETVAGTVKAGERVHLACVQTETKRMLFLNGKLAASTDNPLAEVKPVVGKLQFSLVNNVPNGPPIDVLVDGVRISQAVRYTKDFTPPGRHVPDKETLALYHCDEGSGDKLTDSSGNNLHGKVVNAKWGKPAAVTVPPPAAAGALRFAEATDTSGVTVPTLHIPDKGPYTVEGYVTMKADQGYAEHRVLFGREYQFALTGHTGETASFNLWSGGRGKYVHATADKLPNPTKRFHVACVRTDTEHLLFVDGKQVAKSAALATGPTGFHIGLKVAADFAEIRVSSVARYKNDFVPAARFTPDKDTVALWHCDDGTGDKLTDSTGNNHHGKIVGGTWVKPVVVPVVPSDADRKVAAWVFSKGGTVQVRGDGRNLERAAELPNGPVVVTAVNLYGKQTADDELANLAGLSGLEVLSLNGTRVTDKALVHLKGLTSLKSLDLVSTAVVGDGLTHLAGLKNLTELALFNRPITDDGLAHLKGLKALTVLQLAGTQVSDKGLVHLKGLKNLQLLFLTDTKVTAAGLPHLTELKALVHLQLQGLPLKAKDLEPLRQALPKCKIEYDGGTLEPK